MTAKKVDSAMTSRRRFLIGPICFVHVFTFGIYNSTIVLFYPEYLGKFLFPNTTSETSDSSVCKSEGNSTETENGKIIQTEVARFSIYASLCVGIPCIIANLLLGSISDRYGRKKMLMIPTIGLLLVEMSTAILMYFEINLNYFLIPMIFQGFVGDTFSLVQFVMSYVSDITENNRSRTFGIAIIECCIGMGVVIGGLVAGYVIEAFGYMWPVVMSSLCKILNIILIFCLPPTNIQNKSTDSWNLKMVVDFLKQSLQFYYSKKYRGVRWKYNICITVYILGCVCLIGRNAAEVLYIISPPFCFSPVLVGWYHAAQHTLQQGISMLLIRVFLVFMNAEAISIMGALSGIAGFIVQGVAGSTTILFLSLVIGFGMALGIPTMRGIMSKETPSESQGALFGGMAAAQTACTYFGSLVFGAIYEGTVYFFNGTVFMFMAGLCLISFVLSVCLLIIPKCSAIRDAPAMEEKDGKMNAYKLEAQK